MASGRYPAVMVPSVSDITRDSHVAFNGVRSNKSFCRPRCVRVALQKGSAALQYMPPTRLVAHGKVVKALAPHRANRALKHIRSANAIEGSKEAAQCSRRHSPALDSINKR